MSEPDTRMRLLRSYWDQSRRLAEDAGLTKLPRRTEGPLIPCSLTLFREVKEDEISKVTVYGQGETPPEVGSRFLMMTNDKEPETVVTGVINRIEWSGKPLQIQVGDTPQYPRAIFYTGGSTYRWDRLEGEDANEK